MNDLIPIITATIALIGTVIGLIFGYKKWKSEQNLKSFGQFGKDKQNAYKELWNRVEEFNIKVRLEEVDSNDFSIYLQNLNAFLLKSGIYIKDEDRVLANDYVEAVYLFQKTVKDSDIEAAKVPLGDTAIIPPHVFEQSKEIKRTQQNALSLRDELLTKIRKVLGGK
jgi:hypothetical protein